MFVRAVVVDDDVQVYACRCFLIDFFEKANEFLMTMSRHTVANHFPIQNIQSSEQRRCAVPFIVMRESAAASGFHRQSRLSSVQGLDLRFFIHAKHESFFRRIHVKAHNILQFFNKPWVSAELERLRQMRFEIVLFPNAAYRGFAQSLNFSHCPRTALRCVWRFGVQRRFNNRANFFGADARHTPRSRSILLQSRKSKSQEALPPQLYGRARHIQFLSNVLTQYALGSHTNNLSTLDQPRRNSASTRPSIERRLFFGGQYNRGCTSAHETHGRIPKTISKVINDAIH